MKYFIYFSFFISLVSIGCIPHNSINNKIVNKPINIEHIIKLKENDKEQQKILINLKNNFQRDDYILVQEFKDYYKITVEHPSENGFTGGAESYKVDKKTGTREMLWHEHPMELP